MSEPPVPEATAGLVGHQAAEQALLEAWRAGRLPHAWLLAGPRGIGKATLAYRFARFLLSRPAEAGGLFGDAGTEAASLAVPEDSEAFRQVANRAHPGLMVLERTVNERTGRLRGEIVVDQVRELNRFFSLTGGRGAWRIAIVDGADEMNQNAANAILKTLEEPPRRSVILLLAHAAGRLLPTIRSRCRLLTLRPLEEAAVVEVLRRQLPEADAAELAALARLSEGSPGRALALAASEGLALYRQLVAITERLPAVKLEEAHQLGDRLNQRGGEALFRVWSDLFGLWLARSVRAAAGGAVGAEAVPGEWALAERIRQAGDLDRWVELWEKTGDLAARADSLNLERKQVVLNAFMALEATARGVSA